jgi:DNA modification methylase
MNLSLKHGRDASLQMEEISPTAESLSDFVPKEILPLKNPQTDIPRIAKDVRLVRLIEEAVGRIPTNHFLNLGDARGMSEMKPSSVHLVVTSPPYWTLEEYRTSNGQMGHIADYEQFLTELDKVWAHCFRALVEGGRLICVVGDVCLSRRKNNGRHTVVPLHASIQEHCRKLGFDNLAPIIWHKIANAVYEVENGSSFLGKPYEPNSVIKNDIEFILMQRKGGGYRTPDIPTRILSVISDENHKQWFQQIWSGVTGASTRSHPAPYPVELVERLIRMFSFVGDTVLDPFLGTGTTTVAAAKTGRHSIGFEVDEHYFDMAHKRIANDTLTLFSKATIKVRKASNAE